MYDEEVYEKYRKAGEILKEVKNEAIPMIKKEESILKVAEFVEKKIVEMGGGIAFPCNIARNEEAAHSTPQRNDERVFEDDIVKLDIGVHVDGYIADSAITIDLSGNPELVRASEEALKAAIEIIEAGVNTSEIGDVIETTIKSEGFRPIYNLTGHGLMRYIPHAPPPIPNRKVPKGVELPEGVVIAIEPFATDGVGKVVDGEKVEIFQTVSNSMARLPMVRKLQRELKKYKTLPYAKRWLPPEKLEFALSNLQKLGIVRGYPVLKEVSGGLVSQAEHSLIVLDGGCEVIT